MIVPPFYISHYQSEPHSHGSHSNGDFSRTSRIRPSARPLRTLFTENRTFCPGTPFFTITVLPSTVICPLLGNATFSITPSNTCPFFMYVPFCLKPAKAPPVGKHCPCRRSFCHCVRSFYSSVSSSSSSSSSKKSSS